MVHTFVKTILGVALVYSGSAAAEIISFTQSSVSPGVVSYSSATAFPTPHQAPGPAVQDLFAIGESVRIADMLNLQALTPEDEDVDSGNPDTFEWETFWYNTLDLAADPVYGSYYEVSWADIATWQNDGLEALRFVTDAYAPTTAGNWVVDTFYEYNTYRGSAYFDVPEPSTLFLLGLGLVGVVARKRVAA